MRQHTVPGARWSWLVVAGVVLAGAWLVSPARGDDNKDNKSSDNSSDAAQPAAAAEGEKKPDGGANASADQPGEGRGRRDPKQMLERMRSVINEVTPAPTDEQKKKLDEAFAKATAEFDKVAADLEGATPEQRREKVGPIFQTLRQDVESTLNEEQKKALAERFQRFGPGGAQGGPGGPGGPGFGRGRMIERFQEALTKIGVTDEQRKQIDPIVADAKAKVDAARQKAESAADDEARRAAWREVGPALRESFEKVNAILTPEQQEKLRQEMPRRGGRGGGGEGGGGHRGGPDDL